MKVSKFFTGFEQALITSNRFAIEWMLPASCITCLVGEGFSLNDQV